MQMQGETVGSLGRRSGDAMLVLRVAMIGIPDLVRAKTLREAF
jgi:hypothetical protein